MILNKFIGAIPLFLPMVNPMPCVAPVAIEGFMHSVLIVALPLTKRSVNELKIDLSAFGIGQMFLNFIF